MTTSVYKDEALKEIERCVSCGVKGIKLLPTRHGYYALDNPILDDMMELADEHHLIVLTHTDTTDKVSTPDNAKRLALKRPTVTVVAAHFGMDANMCHWVPGILKDAPNLILDTSATPNIPKVIFVISVKILGAERVVFGTNCSSLLSPEVELKKIEVAGKYHGLSKEVKRKILGENAIRFLNISNI